VWTQSVNSPMMSVCHEANATLLKVVTGSLLKVVTATLLKVANATLLKVVTATLLKVWPVAAEGGDAEGADAEVRKVWENSIFSLARNLHTLKKSFEKSFHFVWHGIF